MDIYIQTLWLGGAPHTSTYSETASGLRYPVRCGSRWLKSSLINLMKEAEGFMSSVKSGVQVDEYGDGG
jgi:hypothetical protein